MAHYLLYIDDSGNREYDQNRNYVDSGRSRYFVYGGILGLADEMSRLAHRIHRLKLDVVRTAHLEIKSNWLRIPHERYRRYRDPYGVTDDELTRLSDGCHDHISNANVSLLASVIDKLHMQEHYAEPWYPPTAAYEVLLQRAVQAVPAGSTLAVTVDDISGSTPRRNQYKDLLQRHHERLRQHGSSLQRTISFACLSGPVRFVLSQDSHLLQAADLVAYNVHRQFRDHGQDWEVTAGPGAPLPMYEHFRKICARFRTDENGRVQGFGIVKFPLLRRVHWTVNRRERDEAAP